MKFDDLLTDFLKMPKTKEEAKAYLKKVPSMAASIEDMAFKETVINILILSGCVTENDLNASLKHFQEDLYDKFADELLKMVEELESAKDLKLDEADLPEDNDNNEETVAKA